jgi:multifunctional methyltransferase subunit TRM112
MRLLTHNLLRNNAADAKGKGYPLRLTATKVRVDEHDDDSGGASNNTALPSSLASIASTLDWPSLVQAATAVGIATLPEMLTDDLLQDPDFCRACWHVLLHVHVVQGTLTCPVTQREFAIHDGIPNMMLDETEV